MREGARVAPRGLRPPTPLAPGPVREPGRLGRHDTAAGSRTDGEEVGDPKVVPGPVGVTAPRRVERPPEVRERETDIVVDVAEVVPPELPQGLCPAAGLGVARRPESRAEWHFHGLLSLTRRAPVASRRLRQHQVGVRRQPRHQWDLSSLGRRHDVDVELICDDLPRTSPTPCAPGDRNKNPPSAKSIPKVPTETTLNERQSTRRPPDRPLLDPRCLFVHGRDHVSEDTGKSGHRLPPESSR